MQALTGKPFKPLPRKVVRSKTVSVNVVQRFAHEDTVVNIFIDGMATSSHTLPGIVSLAEALIWHGTQLKLTGDPQ